VGHGPYRNILKWTSWSASKSCSAKQRHYDLFQQNSKEYTLQRNRRRSYTKKGKQNGKIVRRQP